VRMSCCDCRCNTIFAEIHGGQVIAHLARRITTMFSIAESELAPLIVSPTFHGFVVKDCARVEGTSRNRRRH
jgi:hypothetical protein